MGQNSKAVAKRREEIKQEKLDKQVKYYYYQKGAGEHYREVAYMSGKIERTDFND